MPQVLLTLARRWSSGAARYFSNQAGNSGERTLRYSRISGVRLFKQCFFTSGNVEHFIGFVEEAGAVWGGL